jgi:DNA-binding transcriptional MocR family regulator
MNDTSLRQSAVQFSQIAQRVKPSGIRAAQAEGARMISFSKGHPDPDLFPVETIKNTLRQLLSSERSIEDSLQYSAGIGIDELRFEISQLMGARGVPCKPENVLITNGSQQGLFLGAMAFADQGQGVFVRQPVYSGALQVFDALGLVTSEERQANTALIYEIPNFHNPTGVSLDVEARKALVEQAHETGAIILEDDPYGELRFEGADLPGLLAIDAARGSIETTRTLYMGSLSKTVAPGLRIGWIVGASDLISRLGQLKYVQDIQCGTFVQQVATGVLQDDYAGKLEITKAAYKARRDLLLAALETHFGARGSWVSPEGGFFMWLKLNNGVDAAQLLRHATKLGLDFVPGQVFGSVERFGSHLRLGFPHTALDDFDIGAQRLAQAYDRLVSGSDEPDQS